MDDRVTPGAAPESARAPVRAPEPSPAPASPGPASSSAPVSDAASVAWWASSAPAAPTPGHSTADLGLGDPGPDGPGHPDGPAGADGTGGADRPGGTGVRGTGTAPGDSGRGRRPRRALRPGEGPRDWLRAAGRPHLVGLLVLVLVVGGAFVRLGMWQLDRAGFRAQEAAQVERAERLAADPVPIAEVFAPQTAMTADEVARRVAVTGEFDAEQQVLVPGREVGGVDAVMVVTALHVTQGPHDGAILPVLRGWIPAADLAATRLETGGPRVDGLADVVVPDPPSGVVEVTGLLNGPEAVSSDVLPPGQLGSISPGQLTNLWGGPMFSGYLVLEIPAQEGMEPAPAPSAGVEPGLNLQSLAYAFEWWAFAAFAVFMWWRVLRDDVHDARDRAAAVAAGDGGAAAPQDPGTGPAPGGAVETPAGSDERRPVLAVGTDGRSDPGAAADRPAR
ncbi:SURF1 family protein [Georgenia faecalis]|uniref:SURF1 family protein n=1 Tax=Georgenia faecalis TaxID=2483799 RepID=UPI0013DE265F|nr:SURF1 family protein [Georgenia faecalis]